MAITAQQPLGDLAQGTFGQGARPTQEALDLLVSDVFTHVASQWLIGVCGDERCDTHGSRLLLPAGFGGFASLVVTDALTTRQWYKPGMVFLDHAIAAWEAIHHAFPAIRATVHTDTAAQTAMAAGTVECGCAALAKTAGVLELLVAQQDQIAPAYRETIVANARELLENGYAQPNTAHVVEVLGERGVDVEVLAGPHDGSVLIRNLRKGTVIDRPAFYTACDAAGIPRLSVFEYDQWAMREAAERLTDNPELFFAAGDALMMATIRAIGHKDLVVITVE